jgi:hypothetical protein
LTKNNRHPPSVPENECKPYSSNLRPDPATKSLTKETTGEIAAIAELTGVHMDARTRKSIEFPPDILATGREFILRQKGNQRSDEDIPEIVPGRAVGIDNTNYSTGIGYVSMCE